MPFLCLVTVPLVVAAEPAPPTAKEALKPFNLLVGTWKGTGYPDGPKADRTKDFWSERVTWEWKFKGDDCWLAAAFAGGRHFASAELRYLPADNQFRLTTFAQDKKSFSFTGVLAAGKTKEQILTLERTDPESKRVERLVFTFLHSNRHLYRFESKPAGGGAFARQYQVGLTKEGEPFANVPAGPECVVSGGRGTIPVTHAGKTYYVCCSGCKEAFKDEPEKFIKEYEAKQKQK
jgi:hypothetical protein